MFWGFSLSGIVLVCFVFTLLFNTGSAAVQPHLKLAPCTSNLFLLYQELQHSSHKAAFSLSPKPSKTCQVCLYTFKSVQKTFQFDSAFTSNKSILACILQFLFKMIIYFLHLTFPFYTFLYDFL